MIPNLRWGRGIAVFIVAFADFGLSALAGSQEKPNAKASSDGTARADSSMQLNGEESWSMNCQRCHNSHPATMYSDAQWEVVVHHMRVRANITGAEQRAIVEFLKSSN